MTKRQALRLTSFILISVIITVILTNFLRDRTTTLDSFYSLPNNSVDVIVVGSSHVNSTYIPAIMWKEYGISTHNVFSWSQPMWISYHYIKEALKTQKPKAIVLELYGMMYGNSYIMPQEIDDTNYKNSFSIDPGINFLQMTQTVKNCGIDLRRPKEFFNLIRYHSRWENINESFFTYNPHRSPSADRGYGFLLENAEVNVPDTNALSKTDLLAPYEKSVEYLDKICKLAKDNDIKLMFTMSPYGFSENEVKIFNYLSQYASEKDIPFINFNMEDASKSGFDFKTDLADNGHTNFYGGAKITRYLSDVLLKNLPELKNSNMVNAKQNDEDANFMYRTFLVNDYFKFTNKNEYLAKANTDENLELYTFIKGNILASCKGEEIKAKNDVIVLTENDVQYTGALGKLKIDLENENYIFVYDNLLKKPLELIFWDENDNITHREIVTSDYK